METNLEIYLFILIHNGRETSGFYITNLILLSQLKISISRFIKRKLVHTENKETFSFNFFNTKILNKINKQDVDIVHLHWIGNEMISISQLKKIKKPIVWSFWDMWPICGAEHHSYDDRYING